MNILKRLYPNSPAKTMKPNSSKSLSAQQNSQTISNHRILQQDSNIAIQVYDSQQSNDLVTKLNTHVEEPNRQIESHTDVQASHRKPPKINNKKKTGERSPLLQDDQQSLAYSISMIGEETSPSELVSKIEKKSSPINEEEYELGTGQDTGMKDIHAIKEVSLIRRHKDLDFLKKKAELKISTTSDGPVGDSNSKFEGANNDGQELMENHDHEDYEEITQIARSTLFLLGPKICKQFGQEYEFYEELIEIARYSLNKIEHLLLRKETEVLAVLEECTMLSHVALTEIQSSAFKKIAEEEQLFEECIVNTRSLVDNFASGLAFRLSIKQNQPQNENSQFDEQIDQEKNQ